MEVLWFVHHLWNSDPLAVRYNPACRPRTFHYWSLFTLPILIGVSAALFLKSQVILSDYASVYLLGLGTGISVFIDGKTEEKLNEQGVPYSQFISSPAPFTTLLWRTLGIHNDQYFETYYSLFDGDAPLSVNFYPRNLSLLKGMDEHPPVAKLENFTHGYFGCLKIMDRLQWPIWGWVPNQTMFFNSKSQSLMGQKRFLPNQLDFSFRDWANCMLWRGSGILKHGLIKRRSLLRILKNSLFLNPISKTNEYSCGVK